MKRSNLAHLNLSLSVGLLVSLILTPIAHGQSTCADATANVNQVCCQDQTSWGGLASSVNVLNCLTGQREQVPCISKSAMPGGGADSDRETSIQGETGDSQSPVWAGQSAQCRTALQQMDALCPPQAPDAPPFTLECNTQSGTALVTCESLQRFDAMLSQRNCEFYSPEEVNHLVEQATSDPFREIISRSENDPLQTIFQDLSGIIDPGATQPPATTLIPPGQESRAVPFLRIEFPGNFLRYHLANAGLRQGIQQLNGMPGFSCDSNALTCSINPLKVADLKPPLNAMNGENFRISIRDTADGYEVTDVILGAPGDLLGIRAHWIGSLKIKPRSLAGFDLKNNANLAPIPLHDPLNRNGYPTTLSPLDDAHSYLDSAIVVTRMPRDRCVYFDTLVTDGVLMTRNYVGHMQPLACSCPGAVTDNYCIFDPYPRDRPALTDSTLADLHAGNAQSRLVYCSPTFLFDRDPVARPQPNPSNGTFAEADLPVMCSALSISGPTCDRIANDMRLYGCSGSTLKRFVSHPGPNPDLPGRPVTSAAGLGLGAMLELGAIETVYGASVVEISLEVGAQVEEWFKILRKRWIGFDIFRWVINLIMRLLSGVLSALATVTMMIPPNDQWVSFGTHKLMVHGLLSHQTRIEPNPASPSTSIARPQVSAGIRRIWADLPSSPNKVNFDVTGVRWTFDSCGRVSLFGSGTLIDKLRQVGQCAFESISNVVRFAVNPVIKFFYGVIDLFTGIGEKLKKLVSNTVVTQVSNMEKDNSLAQLLASSIRTVALAPYYMKTGDPADGPATLLVNLDGTTTTRERVDKTAREQPPGLSQACLLHPNPGPACLLSQLFSGSVYPLMQPALTEQVDVLRMGAKTHYRSLQDFDGLTLDSDFPPVRFCQEGDNPPGSSGMYRPETHAILTDFSPPVRAMPLKRLTDFNDIHVSPDVAVTPLDWRTQCAVFADLKVLGDVQLQSLFGVPQYELKTVPTKRTNVLLNEVFFCKDNIHCSPSVMSLPDGQAMRQRAELAICSMSADLWYKTAPPGVPLSTRPFQSVLEVATDPGFSDLLHNRLCPWMPAPLASRCHQAANDTVNVLNACRSRLQGAGWAVPSTIPPDP